MRHLYLLVSAPLLLCLLASCGSSGGGTSIVTEGATAPNPNEIFDGAYQIVGFSGEQDGVETMTAFWGSLAADGSGLGEFFTVTNELGLLTPAVASSPIDYQVQPDQIITLGELTPGYGYLRGGITSDGRLAGAMTALGSSQPSVWLFGRRGAAPHSDATVQGAWHFARYTSNIAVPLNVSGWGSISFDGMGAGTFEESNNQEGATFGPINPPCTYEVFDDGRIGLLLGPGNLLIGSIVEGGQVILAAGSNAPGEPPSMYVFVREAMGMSDADFAGDYQMVGFGHESGTNAYWSITAGTIADGAGVNTFIGMRNEDGTTTTTGFDSAGSAVSPNGLVTFTNGAGDTYQGAISQDASVVVGAGATNAGGEPALFLFLR